MISSMNNKFEELKENPSNLLDYNAILAFYPDYYKIKENLKYELFLAKKRVDNAFENNYRHSDLYEKLKEENFKEEEIYEYMKQNKNEKYDCLKLIFDMLLNSCNDLCDLIDYIGHYPEMHLVSLENEKKSKMEKLLENYDINVGYSLNNDAGEAQIQSDDIVRVIEKLEENLVKFKSLKEDINNQNFVNTWFCLKNNSDEERKQIVKNIINEIEYFPLSLSQKECKSKKR